MILTLLTAGAADGAPVNSRLVIERAYRDPRGNVVISFAMDPSLESALGVNTHFWGNPETKRLYQIHESVSAPVSDTAYVVQFSDPRLPRGKDGQLASVTKKMRVTCEGTKTDFSVMPDGERALLNQAVQQGQNRLIPLRDTRVPAYLFKVKGTNEFIYVDRSRLDPSMGSMQVFVGEARHMKRKKITKTDRIAGGASMYFKFRDGGVIYVPEGGAQGTSLPPVYNRNESGGGSDEPLIPIDPQKFALDELGFAMPAELALRTPCDPIFEGRVAPTPGATPVLKHVADYVRPAAPEKKTGEMSPRKIAQKAAKKTDKKEKKLAAAAVGAPKAEATRARRSRSGD
jgi:hypothetical protein